MNYLSDTKSSLEPNHVQGHSTAVSQTQEGQYLCPECGKTFSSKEVAEKHLHQIHWEHLRTVHGEYHEDTGETHQK